MRRMIWPLVVSLFLGAVCEFSASAQAPAASGDPYHLNDRKLSIPITLPASLRRDIAKLTLYVSTDQGKTWRQESTASASDLNFQFDAPADGSYWFNVSYTDKNGNTAPKDAEIYNGPAQLKVVVDTKAPEVKLEVVERMGDVATLSWDVKDDTLDASKVRLEYKPEGATDWHALDLGSNISAGKKRFTLGGSGPVTIRLTAQDLAENKTVKQADSAQPSVPPVVEPAPKAEAANNNAPTNSNTASKPVQSKTASMVADPPTLTAPPPSAPSSQSAPATPPALAPSTGDSFRPAAPTTNVPAASGLPLAQSSPNAAPPAAPQDNGAAKVIASSQPGAAGSATGYAAAQRSGGSHPVVFTNQTHLELDYDIPKAGPSGIGMVELWVTQDNGRTWKKAGEKNDPQPPYVYEAPGEGVYGFTMIVKSKAGLGRRDPVSGDLPELRVEIDTTAPLATLYPPEADPRRKDMLTLIWKAEDRNLGASPIALQWAEKQGGPWNPIGVDLANTGRFHWKMPEQFPYRVYLRLETRDLAGNVGIAETPEPVLVDLTEPEVRIKGLLPHSGSNQLLPRFQHEFRKADPAA